MRFRANKTGLTAPHPPQFFFPSVGCASWMWHFPGISMHVLFFCCSSLVCVGCCNCVVVPYPCVLLLFNLSVSENVFFVIVPFLGKFIIFSQELIIMKAVILQEV